MKPGTNFFLLGVAIAPSLLAGDAIRITDAWARATPPGAETASAYLTIGNSGPRDRLAGVRCDCAREVQIHETVEAGGMMRMRRLASVELEPGEKVAFTPGGLHLMLIDIEAPLEAGDMISLELDFEGAGNRLLTIPVVDARKGAP